MKNYQRGLIAGVLVLGLSDLAIARTETNEVQSELLYQNGGYTQIVVDTKFEQKYPLLQVTNLEFPFSIKYVGQAMNFALALSGYQLENINESSYEILALYSKKLPIVNRSFTRSTTKQILEVIIGNGYTIDINETSRIVRIRKSQIGS
ncbi:hypothetical protein [Vibrio sp. 1180_3]|uniref:hypothetical protein n=1 Tax=Vibrio sp. 1180_3 TaxID=2528832 RepID=UPI002404A480|nr:hypothetical protein [Vibrio sp. 1180_3]MDF9399107.1 hypothetical protein [Vibrio sp. 1180_3]